MSDDDDFPDDIREAARRCIASWGPHGQISLDDAIAAALMAERERCAKIAWDWEPSAWGDEVFAARTIAAAIVQGDCL
jgi:hypothetical protein